MKSPGGLRHLSELCHVRFDSISFMSNRRTANNAFLTLKVLLNFVSVKKPNVFNFIHIKTVMVVATCG
jgi:hypothetical protein